MQKLIKLIRIALVTLVPGEAVAFSIRSDTNIKLEAKIDRLSDANCRTRIHMYTFDKMSAN